MSTFNERLIELQSEKKLLKKDIAAAIGVTYRHYQRYENGDAEPTLSVIIKLADYFKCSVDYLTGRVQKDYLTLLEEAEDEYLLAITEERLKSNRPTISHKEMWDRIGVSEKDAENVEADEFE